MIPIKIHRISLLLFICACIFAGRELSFSEDMLSKKGAAYLGWAQPKGIFLTCDQTHIQIEPGRIDTTVEKCPQSSGPFFFGSSSSQFKVIGEVKGKDISTHTVELKDKSGSTKAFYYLPSDSGSNEISLDDINVGDRITIAGPIEGRATEITLDSIQKKEIQ